MNQHDLKGLKYYIAYAAVVLGFFVYSGAIGWKWFNNTPTENSRPAGGAHRTGHYLRYHK
jgi:hypothetical protein